MENVAETFWRTTMEIDGNGVGVIPAVVCVLLFLGFLLFRKAAY